MNEYITPSCEIIFTLNENFCGDDISTAENTGYIKVDSIRDEMPD